MTDQLRAALAMLATPRGEIRPSSAAFPPLDADALALALELDSRAHAAGRDNLPAADANGPDATEQAIGADLAERANQALRTCTHELELYAERAARHAIGSAHQARIEAAGESALADYVALTRDDIDQLFLERNRVREADAELEQFRTRHHLQRAARLTGSRARLLRWLVLAVIVLAEAITNGLFFATASTAGVIGGITQALGFALLNVGMAVMAARVFRPWTAHRNVALQLLGMVALLAAATWCLALNLTLAHFRDLYTGAGGTVAGDALLQQLLGQPLLLADFQSWLLAALGIGFAIVAFVDAVGLADPYPGYEAVARAREHAIRDYTDAKADCLAGLMQRRNAALDAMQAVIAALERSQHEYQAAAQGQARLHAQFAGWLDQLCAVHAQLVSRYREANQRSRTTPAPAWFNAPATLTLPEPPALAPLPAADRAAAEAAVQRMREYIRSVNARYEDALEQHASLQLLTGADC